MNFTQNTVLTTVAHWCGFKNLVMESYLQMIGTRWLPPPTGYRLGKWPSIAIRKWDCLSQFWSPTWVLSQWPLDGPCRCLTGLFQLKHDRAQFYNLSHEFYQKRTHKTRQNIARQERSFQGTYFECHGHPWTFDLKTSQNSTYCLYML